VTVKAALATAVPPRSSVSRLPRWRQVWPVDQHDIDSWDVGKARHAIAGERNLSEKPSCHAALEQCPTECHYRSPFIWFATVSRLTIVPHS